MVLLKCFLKRFASRPFDRDRAVEMSSPLFHLGRYKPINWSTCADHLWWPARAHDRCAMFHASLDPMHHEQPCHLHFKECVGLSPTREKLRKAIGFIMGGVLRELIFPSDIRKAEHIIYIINYINISKYCAAWARVALPRGLSCHAASTWVLR